jgi:hypothetical protein
MMLRRNHVNELVEKMSFYTLRELELSRFITPHEHLIECVELFLET